MMQTDCPNGKMIAKERVDDPNPQTELHLITYCSQGLRVKGYLAVPKAEKGVQFPGLIYCRGGIRRVGMVRPVRIAQFAARGYAVFAPFYRGNEGGEGREDFAGEDRHDVCNALKAMKQLTMIEPGSVPLIGFSRGAMMALLTAKDCDGVGPVVVWGGVSDLMLTYEERIDLRRMLKRVVGHPRKQPDEYRRRSPLYYADEIRTPLMIVHGEKDEQVGVSHAVRLSEALLERKIAHELRIYPGLGHVFPKDEDKRALDEIFAWIGKQR